jgi:hypothetical protein
MHAQRATRRRPTPPCRGPGRMAGQGLHGSRSATGAVEVLSRRGLEKPTIVFALKLRLAGKLTPAGKMSIEANLGRGRRPKLDNGASDHMPQERSAAPATSRKHRRVP